MTPDETPWPAPTHDTPRAHAARILAPRFSYCLRCGMPWNRVRGHTTSFNAHEGCFPLCEDCWTLLGHPEARIPYYRTLIDAWITDGHPVPHDTERDIRNAVAAGH